MLALIISSFLFPFRFPLRFPPRVQKTIQDHHDEVLSPFLGTHTSHEYTTLARVYQHKMEVSDTGAATNATERASRRASDR